MKISPVGGLLCLLCSAVGWNTAAAQTGQDQKEPQQQQAQGQQGTQQQQQGGDQQQPQQQAQDQQGQQQGQQGQQQQPQRPQYLDLVYDEDWSHLKDVKGPADFFDPIKYIRLNDRGWYLSLGGEIRERYDGWHNALFGYSAATWLNDSLQRYMFHADLHMGEHVRFFAQVASALEYGKKGGPWYGDKDTFEVHQAFADFSSSSNPGHYTLLRVGRQEVALGTDHFVATSDFFNVRRTFDGARLVIGRGAWSYLLEATKPVLIKPGAVDDVPEHGRTSYGGGLFAPNPFTRQGRTGFFYIALDTKRQLWQRGLGRDNRHTVGGRIEGFQRGVDYTYELIGQFGVFTPLGAPSTDIRAWAATSDTGYTFTKSHHYPRFGLRADVTSGDSGHGDLGTFHPLFPDTAYSGKLGLIGPSNVIDLTPTFRFGVTRSIYFLAEWTFFWRQNTNDAIYSPSLLTTPVDSGITGYIEFPNVNRQRYVGNQVGLGTQFNLNPHLTYTIGYNYLTVGSFLKDTPPGFPPGKNTGYFVMWFTYKF